MAANLSNPTSTASDATSGATSSLGSLSTLTSSFQYMLTSGLDTVTSKLNTYFPPEKREYWKDQGTKFATERPKLTAFLLSQIALSGPALALFFVLAVTIAVFALLAGLLVGLLGAVAFIVFAVGVALCFLLPTLFFTTFAAVFIFLFGLAAYYIIKWFNQKDVPGIHVPLKEGLADQMGIGSADDSKKGTTSNGDSNARTNGTAQKQMNGGRGEHEKTPEKAAHEKKKTQHRDGSQQQQQQHHKKTADRDDNEDQDGDKENRPPKLDKPSGKGKGADAVTGDAREKVNGLTG